MSQNDIRLQPAATHRPSGPTRPTVAFCVFNPLWNSHEHIPGRFAWPSIKRILSLIVEAGWASSFFLRRAHRPHCLHHRLRAGVWQWAFLLFSTQFLRLPTQEWVWTTYYTQSGRNQRRCNQLRLTVYEFGAHTGPLLKGPFESLREKGKS